MSEIKENNKELKDKKPFAFINITLKLFFIHSFNKVAQAYHKRRWKKAFKKFDKKQIKDL